MLSVWRARSSRSLFLTEQETIRAVVLAYAAGKIELEKPAKKVPLKSVRNAPSFTTDNVFKNLKDIPKPYNAESIARFLGWVTDGGRVKWQKI